MIWRQIPNILCMFEIEDLESYEYLLITMDEVFDSIKHSCSHCKDTKFMNEPFFLYGDEDKKIAC